LIKFIAGLASTTIDAPIRNERKTTITKLQPDRWGWALRRRYCPDTPGLSPLSGLGALRSFVGAGALYDPAIRVDFKLDIDAAKEAPMSVRDICTSSFNPDALEKCRRVFRGNVGF